MLPTLPTPPSRDDPGTFSDRADAFLGALPAWGDAANALEQSLQMVATTATSTSSLALSVGSKSITTQTGKAWAVGSYLYVVYASDVTKLMTGQVTAYNGATGDLTLNVAAVVGSGTFATWLIGLSAPTTATANLSGGAVGSTPYQSGANTTAMLAAGAANSIYQANGAAAPSWVAPEAMVASADAAGNNNFPRLSQVATLIAVAATTGQRGTVLLATSAEVIAGTDAAKPVTPATLHAGKMVFGTPQATTAGTLFDFTGIPSWARRITVVFNRVSLNGSANLAVCLGTSGGILASGYSSTFSYLVNDVNANSSNVTTEFGMFGGNPVNLFSGVMSLYLVDSTSNIWASSHTAATATSTAFGGGAVTLPDALTSVRITTSNGTDLFDSGSINIVWE